jgi:hypothetical protein
MGFWQVTTIILLAPNAIGLALVVTDKCQYRRHESMRGDSQFLDYFRWRH